MHAVVMDSLEEYLSGTLEPASQRQVEAHLSACEACREEIAGMQEVSQLFGTFRSEETSTPVPSPGFYARVMEQVRDQKPVPAFAGLFGLDLAFGRRVAFASVLTLAILGSYLMKREAEVSEGPTPEIIMALEDSPSYDSAPAPDNMLITLTAYEQH